MMLSAANDTPWMSSLNGTAPSQDYRSAEPWSFAIGRTWSPGSWRQGPLICAWVPYDGLHMKPAIAIFSVPILRPVSGGWLESYDATQCT